MLCMLLNSLSNVEEYKPILPVVWNVTDLNFNKARSILENWVEQDTQDQEQPPVHGLITNDKDDWKQRVYCWQCGKKGLLW